MATLTHHHEPAAIEHLAPNAKAQRTFMTIIGAGIVLLIIGVIASLMHWGEAHEGVGEAATHLNAGAHAEAHGEEHSVLWRRVVVSLWHSNIFFIGVSVVGTVFMAIQYVAYAGWSVVVKRINEALGAWLIPGGILLVVLFVIGRHDLFHWTHEGIMTKGSANYDKIIAGKSGFLTFGFYLVRMVSYLTIWAVFTWRLRQLSLLEDLNGGTSYFHLSIKTAALFLVLFAVTSSMSAWDWVMSVDVHWF
ncbi:MAG: quinol:cytochrome C oxidoreductase, partial [Hymenobacter sp.]